MKDIEFMARIMEEGERGDEVEILEEAAAALGVVIKRRVRVRGKRVEVWRGIVWKELMRVQGGILIANGIVEGRDIREGIIRNVKKWVRMYGR